VYTSFVQFFSDSDDFQPLSDQMLTNSPTVAGNFTRFQPITILGDSVEEDNETFSVTASVASPNILTQPSTIFVTIVDDNDGTFDDCVVRFIHCHYELTVIAATLSHAHIHTPLPKNKNKCSLHIYIQYTCSC